MENIDIFSALNTNLFTALIPVIISAVTLFFKWLKKTPENDDGYFSKAGVKPIELKLSLTKFNFWKTKKLTTVQKIGYGIIAIILLAMVSAFSVLTYKSMIAQPDKWAALMLIKTKENFLLTYDEAKNIPGEATWNLTPDDCYSDTYENIARGRKISPDLAHSICSQIGLVGEREAISERIHNTQKQKHASMFFGFICIAFFLYLLLALLIDVNIHNKVARYMKEK